jgi:hypothetical protein
MYSYKVDYRTNSADARNSAVIVCLLAMLALPVPVAYAAESPIPITPPGGTDTDQAFLPAPGAYGGFSVVPYNMNNHSYDSTGHVLPDAEGVKLDLRLYIPVFLYVYPFKIFGGSVGSTFVQPVETDDYSVAERFNRDAAGFGDAYTDLFYWTKNVGLVGATPTPASISYGLSVAAGLALIIPDGNYNKNYPINIGNNTWVLDPNVAATYNSGPSWFGDNSQISARAFYGVPFRNSATDYLTGNIFDVDWSLTESFSSLRFGLAGFYQTQITDDSAPGRILVDGNKFSELALGPIVQYFFPRSSVFIKVKYGDTVYHKNFTDEQFLTATIGFKF